jgi:SAM-dependent methyltransferase
VPREPFARMDESDDATFYVFERKVVHLEPGAIEALRTFYARVLPRGGSVLDLMSSWRSHLPDGLGRVVGLGMNSAEMADNPQLSEFVVHDLNREPRLPFDDGSFDAVVCAVSVQYLTRPLEVFAEAGRLLRPGGPVVVSFSNRCFPTKAVAIWRASGDDAHRRLVREYLERSGFTAVTEEAPPSSDDPLFVVWGRRPERA